MARNITVTFDDGSTHVYQNAPDDLTPDMVSARAQKDFGKAVTALDGGRKAEAPQPTQAPKENSLLDRAGQFATGANRGAVAATLGLPVDVIANVKDLAKAGFGTVAHLVGRSDLAPDLTPREDEVGSSAWINKRLANSRLAPLVVPPGQEDRTSRMLQAGGAGLSAGLIGGRGSATGAGIGSGSAMLGQSVQEAGGGDEAAMLASMIGPASIAKGTQLATGAGRAVAGTARALTDPFTENGQRRIATNVIQRMSTNGPTQINSAELVPGSKPTLAEATGNGGIARLQQNIRDAAPNRFVEREQQNADARLKAFGGVAGDRLAIDNAEAAREIAANPLLKKAFTNTKPAEPQNVVDIIDTILKGPSGKRDAVVSTLGNIKSKIVSEDGQLETDAANLYGVRKQIGDMLDKRAAVNNPAAQQASRELLAVRNQLDRAIEKAAPGFGQYRQTYAEKSAPINSMELLQKLNVTDAQGNITLNKINNAITNVERARSARGANDAKSVTPEQLDQLKAIRDDLLRQSNVQAGRAHGSNSVQNLATDNIIANALPGRLSELSLPRNVFGQVGKLLYSGSNEQIRNRLADMLLEPSQVRINSPMAPKPRRVGADNPLATNALTQILLQESGDRR